MSSGLQIFNASGNIQIDSSLVNFVLTAKGTVTIPAGGYINTFPAAQIVINGFTPILCLRPLYSFAAVVNTKIINGQHSYLINGTGGETFSWYLFDKNPMTGNNNSGIQVFNGAGEMTFSSDRYPMRIMAVGTMPTGRLCVSPVYGSLPTPRTGEFAFCLSSVRIDTERGSTSKGFMEGYRITPYGLTGGAIEYMRVGGNMSLGESYFGSQVIVVDVAGL